MEGNSVVNADIAETCPPAGDAKFNSSSTLWEYKRKSLKDLTIGSRAQGNI